MIVYQGGDWWRALGRFRTSAFFSLLKRVGELVCFRQYRYAAQHAVSALFLLQHAIQKASCYRAVHWGLNKLKLVEKKQRLRAAIASFWLWLVSRVFSLTHRAKGPL